MRRHNREGFTLGLGGVLWQLLCNLNEECLCILCRRLQVKNSVFFCIGVRLFEFNLSPRLQISFITSQRNDDVWISPTLKFLDPRLCSCKGVWVCNIVHNDCSRSTSVVHGCQRTITFLSRGIPNLELDSRVIKLNSLCQESGSDSRLMKF